MTEYWGSARKFGFSSPFRAQTETSFLRASRGEERHENRDNRTKIALVLDLTMVTAALDAESSQSQPKETADQNDEFRIIIEDDGAACTTHSVSNDSEPNQADDDNRDASDCHGRELSLSSTELQDADLDRIMSVDLSSNILHIIPTLLNCNWNALKALDLSRNSLVVLPTAIGSLVALESLNLSRNKLRGLPTEIGKLACLVELNAMSNHFRIRLLPIAELAALPALKELDLRYNAKLKEAAARTLTSSFDKGVELKLSFGDKVSSLQDGVVKTCAADRDATLLRSQLEPISTPQLQKRLERTFGVCIQDLITDDNNKELMYDREFVMQQLLNCYAAAPPRTIRYEQGVLVRPAMLESLVAEMQLIQWPKTARERPKISAQHYIILQRPGVGNSTSTKAKREASKLQQFRGIWDKAVEAIAEIDREFAQRFTALAVTKNFQGSPHIDTLNVGPFYGISMGEFSPEDGGKICVECSATEVAEVETRGRFGKLDGRFVHWVKAYEGTRYSLIYYVTSGEVIPQTTAVFKPREQEEGAPEWIAPPTFVL